MYIRGGAEGVGADIFDFGLCLPNDDMRDNGRGNGEPILTPVCPPVQDPNHLTMLMGKEDFLSNLPDVKNI